MAKRNLQDLAALLEIYRQFSPEQKLREEMTQNQIAESMQRQKSFDRDFALRDQTDQIGLDTSRATLDALKFNNQFATDTAEDKKLGLKNALKLDDQNVIAATLGNEQTKKMNPLIFDQTKAMNPLVLEAQGQQNQAMKNENSLFDQRKQMGDLQIQEGKQTLQLRPEMQRSQIAGQAIMNAFNLNALMPGTKDGTGGGYNPGGTDARSLATQETLSALGGSAIPANLTPNIGLFQGMPREHQAMFVRAQNGVLSPMDRQFLIQKYPQAAMRLLGPQAQ